MHLKSLSLGAVVFLMALGVAMITEGQQPPSTIYNPYPPGILPTNLNSELARVEREVDFIEAEAIRQWHALTPPVPTGNPPILKGTGIASVEILGKLMNYDKNISPFKNTACSSCHMPYAAFSGPIPSVNLTMMAYPGSDHFRAGKRQAQRYTYSSYFPPLQYNATQGAFFGGNFWDSRATGYKLRDPAGEQSQFPPLDPAEMGNPDSACITYKLSLAVYRPLFEEVWGKDSFPSSFPPNTASICATPVGAAIFGGSATPVMLSPDDRTKSNNVYDHWAQSISAFEKSLSVSPFTSKFDAFLANKYKLTPAEMAGYDLFRGKGNCNSCHLDGRSTAPAPTDLGAVDTGVAADVTPLFTCFGSSNLGLPKNPRVAILYESTPDSFGFTLNPAGFTYTDFGLGEFLRSGYATAASPNSSWTQFAPTSDGQMQTMTARDVALVPPQCTGGTDAPGPYFQKEFFHNGYIKSLKQLVHFYNTRDVYPFAVESGHCPAGTVEKVTCWPSPEVPQNMDMTVGKLGLTDLEENQIVAFLKTLTDGFTTPYPDINTYTGTCMTGGNLPLKGTARSFQQKSCEQEPVHDCRKGKYEGAWSTHHAPSTAILITRRIDSEGLHMNGLLVRVMVTAAAMMLWPIAFAGQTNPYKAKATEELPPRNKVAHIQITQGPSLETAYSNWAIIRWTSNNPGGSDEHFGIVTYGTDPKNLSETAKSHIRLNRNHPYTEFRVRVDGLQPRTTYYYTVDSMEGNGTRDGVKSPVRHFTTR